MKVFDVDYLKTLETKESIDNYLVEVGYTEYSLKIKAVMLASRSEKVEFGIGEETSDKTKYDVVVMMMLDEDFRYLRGLPYILPKKV